MPYCDFSSSAHTLGTCICTDSLTQHTSNEMPYRLFKMDFN